MRGDVPANRLSETLFSRHHHMAGSHTQMAYSMPSRTPVRLKLALLIECTEKRQSATAILLIAFDLDVVSEVRNGLVLEFFAITAPLLNLRPRGLASAVKPVHRLLARQNIGGIGFFERQPAQATLTALIVD